MEKKIWLATHTDNAGAAILNSTRWASLRFLFSQNEMISPSSATVRVPAGGPKRRTDVKTNVSDTDSEAGIDGSFTVAEPLTTVSAARMNHSWLTGVASISRNDATTANVPATITPRTYVRPRFESFVE